MKQLKQITACLLMANGIFRKEDAELLMKTNTKQKFSPQIQYTILVLLIAITLAIISTVA